LESEGERGDESFLSLELACLLAKEFQSRKWNGAAFKPCHVSDFRAKHRMLQLPNHFIVSYFREDLASVNNIMAGSGNIEPTSPTIVYTRGSYSVGAKDISKAQFNSLFKEFS
jgi:hypothetical protein